jgi:hypothetical protein
MKKPIFLAILFCALYSNVKAQNSIADYFTSIPKLKPTTYIRKNGVYQFSTNKWVNVTDKQLWTDLFGIENNKMWTGQEVYAIHLTGWWHISTNAIGYMYVIDLEADNGGTTPSIFISSYNTQNGRKGIDVDPFAQAPSPTGMRGKVVITQTLKVTIPIIFTLTNKHQSSAKILSKTVKYTIGEDGAVETQ